MLARCTTAAGVSGARPCSISASAMRPIRSIDISRTSVPPLAARPGQSTPLSASRPGSRWPETTVKSDATPRWVNGMPATAGPASALVTPGTTVTGMPARTHASHSSPPRPNTNGSPPLSRTTRLPARARSTSTSLISSWVRLCRCADLPQSITSTCGGSSVSSSRGASRSTTTTSAVATRRRPRTVINSGSPGTAADQRDRAAMGARCRATGSSPRSSATPIASRSAIARRGSSPPLTATVRSSRRSTAGTRAVPPRRRRCARRRSAALRQQQRRRR